MPRSEKIDQYIDKAQPFAQPILQHIRDLVHQACPEVEEKMKWSMPHFDYRGEMMCHMASFKQHCSMSFWKAALMKDPILMQHAAQENSMGHLGRITSLKDLPSNKKLIAFIKEAMQLNEEGIKIKKQKPVAKQELPVPTSMSEALKRNPAAKKTFEAFSASCRREYVEWIVSAKTEATREKRLQQAMQWMALGKKRNWKYEPSK